MQNVTHYLLLIFVLAFIALWLAAWCQIGAIAFGCNLLGGYGSRSVTAGFRLLPILPLLVASALMFIANIDAPRHGLIRVQSQNLISRAESVNPPPATAGVHPLPVK